MGIVAEIKSFLPSRRKKLLAEIMGHIPEQRLARLSRIIYDACREHAAHFVADHAARHDSPFKGVSRELFFHEMMDVNLWVVARMLSGKKPRLLEQIYETYVISSSVYGSSKMLHDTYARKQDIYNSSWNDVTGHQDVFGQKVAEQIFGPDRTFSVPETSFWIISYTYDVMDDLAELQALCRRMKITLS